MDIEMFNITIKLYNGSKIKLPLISAKNEELAKEYVEGTFMQDMLYQLNNGYYSYDIVKKD